MHIRVKDYVDNAGSYTVSVDADGLIIVINVGVLQARFIADEVYAKLEEQSKRKIVIDKLNAELAIIE